MSDTVQILGVAGSLRAGSYNRAALRAAGSLVPAGASLSTFGLEDIPPYNQDAETTLPPAVSELKRAIRQADAVLLVTPEYNFSVPGVLKNAIDWASRPAGDNAWEGKPAAIMGVSSGRFGTTRAQLHLRQVFVYLDVHCINKPHVMIGSAAEAFDTEGTLRDEKARELIRQLLENLVEWTRRLRARH